MRRPVAAIAALVLAGTLLVAPGRARADVLPSEPRERGSAAPSAGEKGGRACFIALIAAGTGAALLFAARRAGERLEPRPAT